MAAPIGTVIQRELGRLQEGYDLHFGGMPRANRSAEQMRRLIVRLEQIIDLARSVDCAADLVAQLRNAYRFLQEELSEITAAKSDPTQLLVADATMTGQLVEHRFRRRQAWNRPIPDLNEQAHQVAEAERASVVAHEIADFVPAEAGSRWRSEANAVVAEVRGAESAARGTLARLARAGRRERDEAVLATIPLLEAQASLLDAVLKRPRAFRPDVACDAADAIGRCMELAPGLRTPCLRNLLAGWNDAQSALDAAAPTSDEDRVACIVRATADHCARSCDVLRTGDPGQVECALDLLVELHRAADAAIGKDFVPSLDPGFSRMRDVMMVAERKLRRPH